MNSVIPQIAHDAKPANPRRVSMISSLLVSGSLAPSGLVGVDRKAFTNVLASRRWGARSPPPYGRVIASARRLTLARDAQAAQRIELLRSQPTTSAARWLCPSLMPRAFIQS